MFDKFMTLNNGVKIPLLALGTWCIEDDKATEIVKTSIKLGYRHIDSAQAYENERGVGEAVRTCGVPREELFVTSKVSFDSITYDQAARSIDESLSKMKLDYLDLMLIHNAIPWEEWGKTDNHYFERNTEVWHALEDAYEAGKIRSIGVSNYIEEDLENIFKTGHIKPMVNQIECHIGETPSELIKFCRAQNIAVEAYSPIAHGDALADPVIVKMAAKYGVSPAQLCIKYTLQLGLISLPKASSELHLKQNMTLDFEISADDMKNLEQL